VLRVGPRSRPGSIAALEGWRALALLRAAVFQGTNLSRDEQLLLDALVAVVRALPLAELQFALDSELGPLLRAWLRRQGAG
jgi:hypothetical protein